MSETENLKSQAFWGVVWSYVNKFGGQIIAIVPAMVLSRLLDPSEYGLIAMAGIFTGLAFQLSDGGFVNALIQKKNADHLDFCSIFYFNIVVSILLYILLYFLSPLCSSFLGKEELTDILRVSGLNLVFLSIGQVQGVIFKKTLQFKKITIRNMYVQLVSMIVSVVMAFTGFGVWALVYQGLIQTLGNSLLNIFMSTWKPTLCFSFNRVRLLFKYGSNILMSCLLGYGFSKVYDIIIGKFYLPSSLAVYNRSYTTAAIFKDTTVGVLGSVSFPVMSQIQDDNQRLRFNVRKFTKILTMLASVVMSIAMVFATPIFHFMYSSKWNAAIPLFQVVCVSVVFYPIRALYEDLISAKGRSDRFLYLSIADKFLTILFVMLTWKMGLIYMIWGQTITFFLVFLLLSHYIKDLIQYDFFQIVRDIAPYVLLAVVMCVCMWVIKWGLTLFVDYFVLGEMLSSFMIVFVGGLLSLSIYIYVLRTLKLRAYNDFIETLIRSVGEKRILYAMLSR